MRTLFAIIFALMCCLACGDDGSSEAPTRDGAIDEPIQEPDGPCTVHGDCVWPQFCNEGTCGDPGRQGDACEDNRWCTDGIDCNEATNLCGVASAGGEPCMYDAHCEEGVSCGEDGTCDATPPPAAPGPLALPFRPSNVATLVQGRMLSADADILIRGDDCKPCACDESIRIGTTSGCYYEDTMVRELDIETDTLDQSGTGDPQQILTVVFVRNLILDDEADFGLPSGPLVVVAQDTIELVEGSRWRWFAGRGYPGGQPTATAGARGDGPGGGGFSEGTYPSGEGGSYCTLGGLGDDLLMNTGVTYGNDELVPLVPGSGGGAPWRVTTRGSGGDGGGAIQFVAGSRIVIGAGNKGILAGGISGELEGSNGGGGGSGGAILLEAPEIQLDGFLEADGGGGGGDDRDGGEGGLGRIRLNTLPGGLKLGANSSLVPDLASGCATMGELVTSD